MNIDFTLDEQTLRRTDNRRIAANSVAFLKARFELGGEWEDFTPTAVFERGSEAYHVLLDENRCAPVAQEVLRAGVFTVSLIGVRGDGATRATANRVEVEVEESGALEGANTADPTPSVTAQLTAKINSILAATVGDGDIIRDGLAAVTTTEAMEALVDGTLLKRYFVWLGGGTFYTGAGTGVAFSNFDVYSIKVSGGSYSLSFIGSLKGSTGATGPVGATGPAGSDGIVYAASLDDVEAVADASPRVVLWLGTNGTALGSVSLRRGAAYSVTSSGGTVAAEYLCRVCGGGTSYEKLVDYTVSADDEAASKTGFTFDADAAGGDFECSALTLFCEFTPSDATGNFEVLIGCGGASPVSLYKRTGAVSQAGQSLRCDLALRGYWTGSSTLQLTRDANASFNEMGMTAKNSLTEPATSVRVASNTVIPAGTTIEVFGVRV